LANNEEASSYFCYEFLKELKQEAGIDVGLKNKQKAYDTLRAKLVRVLLCLCIMYYRLFNVTHTFASIFIFSRLFF